MGFVGGALWELLMDMCERLWNMWADRWMGLVHSYDCHSFIEQELKEAANADSRASGGAKSNCSCLSEHSICDSEGTCVFPLGDSLRALLGHTSGTTGS